MRIARHSRLLAALIPLALAAVAAPAMERTQEANVRQVVKLSSPGEGYTDAPSQVRADLLLGIDGNIYIGSFSGGDGPGAIARLTPAGELTTVHALADDGSEGNTIVGNLMQAPDGNIYGTTYFGTNQGGGSLFRLAPDGTFTILHRFGGGRPNPFTPYTGVTLGPDGLLYGTTLRGGADDKGTIYRITTDGTDFTVLHEFDGDDGENPEGQLVVFDGMLYGTTLIGGARNRGTIYRVSTSGAFELLYSFPAFSAVRDGLGINDVGSNPRAGLMYSTADLTFYGTAYNGGEHGHGTVFRYTPGAEAQLVHAFGGPSFGASRPMSAVVQDDAGNLYGTSEFGGYLNGGSAWRVAPDGTFSLLHGFTGSASDGHTPKAGLLLANGTLYGVSSSDSTGGDGAIFTLDVANGVAALPVQLTVSASEVTDDGTVGENITVEWNAPAGSTCTKIGSITGSTWSGDAGIAGTQAITLLPGIYIVGISCTEADDGDEATPEVVRAAYAGIVVNAPLLSPVDGGGGAGSLSLFWMLLAAALLFRKFSKESRASCP